MSLRERRELVALHRENGGGGGVLFSLVGASGSSYRRPGARLLSLLDGRAAGTLSGGCLEADLLRRAVWSVRKGAVVERYNTAFDDTAEIPYGLGCGGEVDLLLEPLEAPEAVALLEALAATLHGEYRMIATRLPAPARSGPLARIVLDQRGDVIFATEALATESIVDLRRLALEAAHGTRVAAPGGSLFVERLYPPQRLVIFGGGEDARPLARLASEMGWTVMVADGHAQRARAERFPTAQRVAVIGAAADLPVFASDAVVLMTHSYDQDRRLLAELLPLQPRYLGLLGARHRSALLLQEASALAGIPLAAATERTQAPIGLELGGDGPEAVALAIVAQLQHVLATPVPAGAAVARRMAIEEVERLLDGGPPLAVHQQACALYADPYPIPKQTAREW